MSDLRERVKAAIWQAAQPWVGCTHADRIAGEGGDAVLAVFAERERELRARIEALPTIPGCYVRLGDVLALFDEAVSDGE